MPKTEIYHFKILMSLNILYRNLLFNLNQINNKSNDKQVVQTENM